MKRLVFLLALGLAAGALSRWASVPPALNTATPEAWPLD